MHDKIVKSDIRNLGIIVGIILVIYVVVFFVENKYQLLTNFLQ